MITILITGGAGFIGSHLAERLIKDGNRVICIDDYCTGTEDNIRHLTGTGRLTMMHHDVRQPYDIKADQIYNLACPASPVHFGRDPVKTTETCILGAINALNNAHRYGAKVLQASTSEVYGDPEISPQPESYRGNVNIIGPRACYDEGKRCAETLFFDFYRERETRIKVVRIFNTYGPRMNRNDGRVVSNFITRALDQKELEIYGDGLQTRSFCYIQDLIEGLLRSMETDDSFVGPINLGFPSETKVNELARMIISLCKSTSKIITLAPIEDDPLQRLPDISLAIEKLNWTPNIGLEQGLQETIRYYRLNLD